MFIGLSPEKETLILGGKVDIYFDQKKASNTDEVESTGKSIKKIIETWFMNKHTTLYDFP